MRNQKKYIRILYVYHVSSIGGGSYALLNILKGIDRSIYEPIVLLKYQGPLVEELRRLKIEVYFMKRMRTVPYNSTVFTPSAISSTMTLIQSLGDFRSFIRQINPDIVYVNTMMMYPYLRIAKEEGKRTIIHIREHWERNSHKIQRNIAIHNIQKYADQIVAINSYSASMVKNSNDKITIVYDWIDMDARFEDYPLNKILNEDTSNLKIFLYTGGMQPIKGPKEIVESFTSTIKGEDKRLILLGMDMQGVTGWKAYVKKICAKFGIKFYGDYVRELIKRDNRIKVIPATYNITHILQQTYCMLSYFTIPHANLALAESVITKTPTIAALTSEAIEYSLNGTLAILFDANNIESFQNSIISLDSHYTELKEKLENDSYKIKDLFNSERNIRLLNTVYSKVIL